MAKLRGRAIFSSLLVLTLVFLPILQAQQDPQKVPDAPSATRPQTSTPFPAGTKPAPAPQPREIDPAPEKRPANPLESESTRPVPPMQMTTVPRGRSQKGPEDDGLGEFRLITNVNYVVVPVTVKDSEGRLVDGLVRQDFSIYEDGVAQTMRLFTSDPFPLSAALIIDQGMSTSAMKRVNETLPSMVGAFSQYDEVSLYTYDNNVKQVADFMAAGDQLMAALRRSKRQGRTGGVPVVAGPMSAGGPTINGRRVDPSMPTNATPIKETRALNDALLRAALDLSQREIARRRIIFVISDGMERDSHASYSEVLKVLLTNQIIVYSIGVDTAGIPILDKISRARIPGLGTTNILPKYVSATGGEYFSEFTRSAIEQTYARLTEVARNQYTIGYTARSTLGGGYRSIEVRVKRPSLRVSARDGYYPLPPPRPSQ